MSSSTLFANSPAPPAASPAATAAASFERYQNAACSHLDQQQQLSRNPQALSSRVGLLRHSDLWTEQLLGSQPCNLKDSHCWTPQTMCVTQSNFNMFIPLNASREAWLMYKRITYSSVPNPVRPLCRRKLRLAKANQEQKKHAFTWRRKHSLVVWGHLGYPLCLTCASVIFWMEVMVFMSISSSPGVCLAPVLVTLRYVSASGHRNGLRNGVTASSRET